MEYNWDVCDFCNERKEVLVTSDEEGCVLSIICDGCNEKHRKEIKGDLLMTKFEAKANLMGLKFILRNHTYDNKSQEPAYLSLNKSMLIDFWEALGIVLEDLEGMNEYSYNPLESELSQNLSQ